MGCPGEEIETYTFSQEVKVPSNKGEEVVRLSNLNDKVLKVSCQSEWLSAMDAETASPSVLIRYDQNPDSESRDALVIITSNNGDIVNLKVNQEGSANSIEDIHNESSTNPAYSNRK